MSGQVKDNDTTEEVFEVSSLYGLSMRDDKLILGIQKMITPPSSSSYVLEKKRKIYFAQERQDMLFSRIFKGKVRYIAPNCYISLFSSSVKTFELPLAIRWISYISIGMIMITCNISVRIFSKIV